MMASHGAALGGQSPHEHGGGQQSAADLGHHAFGESQPPAVGCPGRLEGGGLRAVAAGQHGGAMGGAQAEASGGRSADQATEDRLTIEAGDAQPVDGTVRADQRGGSGVTEQPVVLDRHESAVAVGDIAALRTGGCETTLRAVQWASRRRPKAMP